MKNLIETVSLNTEVDNATYSPWTLAIQRMIIVSTLIGAIILIAHYGFQAI